MQLVKRRSLGDKKRFGVVKMKPTVKETIETFKVTFNEGVTYTFIESKSGPSGAGQIATLMFGLASGPFYVEEAKEGEREVFHSLGISEIRLH